MNQGERATASANDIAESEDEGNATNANSGDTRDEISGPSSYIMEGYTPLNFNTNAMVEDDSSGSDDDETNDNNVDLDGDMFTNGYYHMMGAPPKRLNGVKDHVVGFAMHHDDHHGDHDDEEALSSHNSSEGDNNRNTNNDADSSQDSLGVPDDFRLLAEQALRGLEVEHISTFERTSAAELESGIMSDSAVDDGKQAPPQKSEPIISSDFEACFASFDDKPNDTRNEGEAKAAAHINEQATQKIEPVTLPKLKLKAPLKSKHMDVNAIQKAMQSIRLKSPSLANNLDAGASSSFSTSAAHDATNEALASVINSTLCAIENSQHQNPATHPIVPSGPLAAFRRNTTKAQTATANLTRSGTISEAVIRLWPLICFRRRMRAMIGGKQQKDCTENQTLTIHILGADRVECSSEDLVRKSVGPFVRWMDAAIQSGELQQDTATRSDQSTRINSLLIEFSGPCMPGVLLGKVVDLLPESKADDGMNLVSAKAIFQHREYHEPSSDDSIDGIAALPADLAIAFNAGIWGYDSWKPTLSFMCTNEKLADTYSGIGKTLFVITAYTVEECEDDGEVIAEVVEEVGSEKSLSTQKNRGVIARQLWAPEPNPFSSRLERKTASAPPGSKYYENGAWQCWLMGC